MLAGMDQMQVEVCQRLGVEAHPSEPHLKLGLALETLGQQPVNGLRHSPEGDTTGWYIWAGDELSSAEDFFDPVHVGHLTELVPSLIPYLALPPGWRFQLAHGHEDVWFDGSLLGTK
jgi:hypothetical protein